MGKRDWNRRTCARRGHTTYAPSEPQLRARLHAATGVGDAWRCLRCGDFALGEPHGSGPAANAPLVVRGKALRDLFVLRFLAVERGLRGVLGVLIAWAVWKFSNSQDALHQLFDQNLTIFKPIADHFHWDLEHASVVDTIRKTFDYQHKTLVYVAAGVLAYSLIEAVEGVGLWLGRRWAEYLAVIATAAFLPLEGYELSEHATAVKIATTVINVLAVLWILLSKRLFGLRGGIVAFEAERHSASLLEVEQAAEVAPIGAVGHERAQVGTAQAHPFE
ncbi:DUF2127 domain-containing protein [Kitasatospora kifunensis]|uniref:Uncharacterized membrane protein (DUF2068 family) n=1 Tax=Kitasatospora kifunensis TaxID=58351 RepID=A0A7W7R143_KITKI|nr:DUF2127 domain-containing protein [Kitasatospora kifunensis]MBB4923511.1 uncharacterized membrane protein (DUF2068 family) [Kitasatospora kifunensis]